MLTSLARWIDLFRLSWEKFFSNSRTCPVDIDESQKERMKERTTAKASKENFRRKSLERHHKPFVQLIKLQQKQRFVFTFVDKKFAWEYLESDWKRKDEPVDRIEWDYSPAWTPSESMEVEVAWTPASVGQVFSCALESETSSNTRQDKIFATRK